jgi:hypothetical protein
VLPGDATQDSAVNFTDLSKLLANYGTSSGASWSQGDFSGDGVVNFTDLSELLAHYGHSLPSGEPAAGTFPADEFSVAATMPTTASSEVTVPSQADVISNVATADNRGLEQPDVLAAASENAVNQAIPTSAGAGSITVAQPLVSGQTVAAVGIVSGTVPSQPDVISNVATADNRGLKEPDGLAVPLPTQPALFQDKAPDVFHASAVAMSLKAGVLQPAALNTPAALTAGVGNWSSPPAFAAADEGLHFVVLPTALAAKSLWADSFSTAAARLTEPLAVAIDNTSLWEEVAPAANGLSSSVPGGIATSLERTQDQVKAVLADQARARDAVLAGEPLAPLPSEVSWLSDAADARSSRHPASNLEPLMDAVDKALTTYNDEPNDG